MSDIAITKIKPIPVNPSADVNSLIVAACTGCEDISLKDERKLPAVDTKALKRPLMSKATAHQVFFSKKVLNISKQR
jgi:hypothetical protein